MANGTLRAAILKQNLRSVHEEQQTVFF